MATEQQRKFGGLPFGKPEWHYSKRNPPPAKRRVEHDPETGLSWDVVRSLQARLKAEFMERQQRRAA